MVAFSSPSAPTNATRLQPRQGCLDPTLRPSGLFSLYHLGLLIMFAKGKARSHGESDGAGQAANGLGVHLNHRIGQLDDEIRSIDEDIQKLQQLKASVVKERNQLRAQAQSQVGPSSSTSTPIASASGTDGQVTNYFTERFPWTGELLPRAQATWKIRGFRSVQEAVCNAGRSNCAYRAVADAATCSPFHQFGMRST